MRTVIIVSLAMLAAAASAGWRNDSTGERWTERPAKIIVNGAWLDNASDADYEAAGIRPDTPAEIEADAIAAAEQAAASEAAMNLPAVFDNGIAVLKDGHHVELVPLADGEPVVGIQISNSPLESSVREQMKAAKMAELVAKKAAKDAKRADELDKLIKKIDKAKDVKELGNAVVAYIKSTKE